MGPPRPARRRRHGRLQPGRHRGRALRGTGGTRRLRGMRTRGGGRRRAAPGGPPASTPGPVRGVAGRPRRLHGPGVGPHGRHGDRLLGLRPGRRVRFRRTRRARSAAPGAPAAVRHGVRPGRGRGRGGRTARRRYDVAAAPRRHRDRRAAVAGGGRHRCRLRVLVHGHAAARRRARHAVLRPHPGRRRLHGPARRNGLLRGRPGRRQCTGRRWSRPRIGRVDLEACRVSGCRRG